MKTIVFLFPGQGSQFVGMGRAMAEAYAPAREVFEQGDEILGFDFSRIVFEGPEEELILTKNAQPAIFLASLACLRAFESELPSLKPVATAGLSLGEFTALVAAGALSFADGLRLVRQRGECMQYACDITPSTMASVMGLEVETVRSILEGLGEEVVVDIANLNCPGQVVISGDVEGVRLAMKRAEEAGAGRAVELQVSGAFHSRRMKPAEERLAATLRETPVAAPDVPVISNVTGKAVKAPEEIREALLRQLTSSVLWEASMRLLIGEGVETFLEFGGGRVLRGLLRKIDRSKTCLNVSDPETLTKAVATLRGEG